MCILRIYKKKKKLTAKKGRIEGKRYGKQARHFNATHVHAAKKERKKMPTQSKTFKVTLKKRGAEMELTRALPFLGIPYTSKISLVRASLQRPDFIPCSP